MTPLRIVCLALLIGCQDRSAPAEAPAAPAAPLAPAAQALSPSEAQGAAAAPSAGGLRWQHGAPFEPRAPKSSMRAAEYGVGGDPRAELAVFHFGPDQGGSVEANVSRWIGQFAQPDGSDSASRAKRDKREVAGVPVTLLEVAGNYSGGMAMPGAPQPEAMPDAMMLAAIAEGPSGPVFFKLVGPRATVERVRGDFDRLVGSITPAR